MYIEYKIRIWNPAFFHIKMIVAGNKTYFLCTVDADWARYNS